MNKISKKLKQSSNHKGELLIIFCEIKYLLILTVLKIDPRKNVFSKCYIHKEMLRKVLGHKIASKKRSRIKSHHVISDNKTVNSKNISCSLIISELYINRGQRVNDKKNTNTLILPLSLAKTEKKS